MKKLVGILMIISVVAGLWCVPNQPNKSQIDCFTISNEVVDDYTVFSFKVLNDQPVMLQILNEDGVIIKTLVDDLLEAGSYDFTWDGTDFNGNRAKPGKHKVRVIEAKSYVSLQKTLMLK